jgi:hypothetical protein
VVEKKGLFHFSYYPSPIYFQPLTAELQQVVYHFVLSIEFTTKEGTKERKKEKEKES